MIKSACLAQLANEKWDALKKEKEEQKKEERIKKKLFLCIKDDAPTLLALFLRIP